MSRFIGLGLVLVMGLAFAFMNRAEEVDPYWQRLLQEPMVAGEGWGPFELGSYSLTDALSAIPGKVYPTVAGSDETMEIELAYVDKAVKLQFVTRDYDCRRSLMGAGFPAIFRQILESRDVFLDSHGVCAGQMILDRVTVTDYEHFPVVSPLVLEQQVVEAFGQPAGVVMRTLEGEAAALKKGRQLAQGALGEEADELVGLAGDVMSAMAGAKGKNAEINGRDVRLTAGGASLRLDRPVRTGLDLRLEGDDLPRVDRIVLFGRP